MGILGGIMVPHPPLIVPAVGRGGELGAGRASGPVVGAGGLRPAGGGAGGPEPGRSDQPGIKSRERPLRNCRGGRFLRLLLALAQRQPPALPGSVNKLYSEKDLLVE